MPSDVDGDVVEQRIMEQGSRLHRWGAVTAWASLRWRGAGFFDGIGPEGPLPVPLVVGFDKLRADAAVTISQDRLAPTERELVAGLWVTTVQRALFDEARRAGTLRTAVVAIDMAAAARLISVWLFATYVGHRNGWTGVPLVRSALELAVDESRSPMETLMRLIWVIDAELPPPLCNQSLYDAMDGAFIGKPDLLDPVAGVVGEYDGLHHKNSAQHRLDVEREAKFRDRGLEYFTVVGGEVELRERIARRMHQTRARAKFLPPESCAWTTTTPTWREPEITLDAYLERRGLVESLTHR